MIKITFFVYYLLVYIIYIIWLAQILGLVLKFMYLLLNFKYILKWKLN